MRRKKQELSKEECIDILQTAKTAVLGVVGDDGYPYTVPINFVYANDKIYFHGAKNGHKIDAINKCNKVSLCVVDKMTMLLKKNLQLILKALFCSVKQEL